MGRLKRNGTICRRAAHKAIGTDMCPINLAVDTIPVSVAPARHQILLFAAGDPV